LKFKEVEGELAEKIQTMGVNANGDLFWNRKWVKGLTEPELMGVLSHEACHIALLHLERMGTRDAQVFNIANDLVVNDCDVSTIFLDDFYMIKNISQYDDFYGEK